MSIIPASISAILGKVLYLSPTAWIKSWLIYIGVQTHVKGTVGPEFKPLHNVCEFLNALHIYTDEAKSGKARTVEAFHFCGHVRKDLRQCLIYDSNEPNARLIGVEYLIPGDVYETLDSEEQKLWHTHEFEVKSGMLIMPTPVSHQGHQDKWESLETEGLSELVGWYGKLYHFWQVDRGDQIPLGEPKLMGSLTDHKQCNINAELKDRDSRFGVDLKKKAERRKDIPIVKLHDNADTWWKEAERNKAGCYA